MVSEDGNAKEGVVVARKAKQAGRLELVQGGEEGLGYCQFTSMANKDRKYTILLGGEMFVAKNFHSCEWLFYRKSNKRRILAKVTPAANRLAIRTVRNWAPGVAAGLEDTAVKRAALQFTLRRGGSLWKRKFLLAVADSPDCLASLTVNRLTARESGGSWHLDMAQGKAVDARLQALVLALVASETIDRHS